MRETESTRSRRSSMTRSGVLPFEARRVAWRGRSHPIIVLAQRSGHPSPEVFNAAEAAISLLGLKSGGSTTDLLRAGRTVAGRGTSDRPPGNAR